MNAERPLVSILTPVYNGQKYLAECIESVLGQTYDRWEYGIVDNCSTDATHEIGLRYARRDPRIQVHTNPQTVSSLANHNIAFRRMSRQAKYCKVVHADDWLFPECLERMVDVAEAHPTAGLVAAFALKGSSVKCDGLPYTSTFLSGAEVCRRTLLREFYLFLSPSSVMFRADLVRREDPFYNEGHLYADTEACFKILRHSDFAFVHQVLSFVRTHDESISAAVAARYNTYILSWLDLLARYGPPVLGRDEYRRLLAERFNEYYRFLGKSLFRRRGREFWDLHRRELARIGYPFSAARLLMGSLAEAGSAVFYPLRTLARTLDLLTGGRGSVDPSP